MKTLIMGTVAALFVAGNAYAQDVLVIVDGETMTMDQYRAALAEPRDDFWFDAWDVERTGVLTREQALENWFAQYDLDRDQILTQDEVKAWNEDNMRLNALREGREVSEPGPAGGTTGAATQ